MGRTAKVNRLTAIAVKRYAESASSSSPLHDGGGLYLRKRDAGAYWYLRLTDPLTGAQQWHRLFADDPAGGYPHKSLADARAAAAELWSLRASGVDPRAAREAQLRAQRDAVAAARVAADRRVTLRQLAERWASIELRPHARTDGKRVGRKDGGTYTLEQFARHVFPRLGDRDVAQITRADVLALLDAQRAAGKLRTANVLLADLKQMFRFAVARDLADRNPLDTVTKRDAGGPSVERDRVLSRDELIALRDALPASGLQPRLHAAIWIILATGCRIGELMGATWQSRTIADVEPLQRTADAVAVKFGVVDLAKRTWRIPRPKNQREHTIHLSEFAVAQFERLRALGSPPPWLFPSADGKRPVDVKAFGKQLSDRQRNPDKRLKNRSTASTSLMMPGGKWNAHDLRRTTATMMAELGISGDVIDECLNHIIESRARRVYVRNRREADQARAFDALGACLEGLLSKAAAWGNVIELQAA